MASLDINLERRINSSEISFTTLLMKAVLDKRITLIFFTTQAFTTTERLTFNALAIGEKMGMMSARSTIESRKIDSTS